MNADGSDRRRLYRSICCIGSWGKPVWSPDETQVAFSVSFHNSAEAAKKSGLYRLDADGRNLRRLSRTGIDPAWQPRRQPRP
jgi:Tol biopolymer transport system component